MSVSANTALLREQGLLQGPEGRGLGAVATDRPLAGDRVAIEEGCGGGQESNRVQSKAEGAIQAGENRLASDNSIAREISVVGSCVQSVPVAGR